MRLILAVLCVVSLTLIGSHVIAKKIPYCLLMNDEPHGIHLEYAPPQE